MHNVLHHSYREAVALQSPGSRSAPWVTKETEILTPKELHIRSVCVTPSG
jgi:hypothetical protein